VSIGRETTAAGDTEVSNSWGGSEPEPLLGGPAVDSAAFNHPGTVITASAGDSGYLNWTEAAQAEAAKEAYYVGADYPASSPHVVAVGGTRLMLSSGAWKSETVWNDDPRGGEENYGAAGGGCSLQFTAQQWQREVADWSRVGCENRRAVADVAADADPYSGAAVYDSVPDFHEEVVGTKTEVVNTPLGWWPIGGTSVASPIVASMFALAGGAHGVNYPAKTLYEHLGTNLLHAVTSGGNGECDALYTSCSGSMNPLSSQFAFDCGSGVLICNAGPGYNGPTGAGTPSGIKAFEPLTEAEIKQKAAEEAAAKQKAAEEAAAQQKAAEEAKAKQQAEEEATARETEEREKSASGEGGSKGGGVGTPPTGEAGGAGVGARQSIAGALPNGFSGVSSKSNGSPARASAGGAGGGRGSARLSHLALTARASAVIARGLPTVSQVAFVFALTAPARVRVTLSRLVRVGRSARWVTAPGGVVLTAGSGRHRAHLRGRGTLPAGRYRLTLAPAYGAARSLVFLLR
jgi:hypothetical protein